MANKANVLFILFEGLADTVIDSQVLSHVAVMQKLGLASFEIWAFACEDDIYQKSLEKKEIAAQKCGAEIKVFRAHRPAKFGALRKNAQIISEALQASKRSFTHVHARTEYSAAVASQVSELENSCLIWDCRGDAVAELDYRYSGSGLAPRLIKYLRKFVFKKRLQRAGAACDRAIFVSQPLFEVMHPYIKEKPYEIIPCSASEELFFFQPDLRRDIRRQLGIGEEQIVLTYLGSMAPYQRFPDTVAHFKEASQHQENLHLLVLTPQLETARQILDQAKIQNYSLKKAAFDEINGFLNATDIAYMLRDETPTNKVATPTKFAEYCLTGLPVIMGSGVEACFRMVKDVGNLVDEQDHSPLKALTAPQRQSIIDKHKPNLSRFAQADLYKNIYKM